jgi:hypothetical protein
MKFKLLLLSLLTIASLSCSAQSFFKPLPKPGANHLQLGSAAVPTVQNSFRPVFSVTAIESSGVALAGGFGIGFQHNVWNDASQTWDTQYSLSAIGFLGTNGNTITGTAGLVVGFLNFVSLGGGYDFTNKKFVLLTGVQLHFN